MHALIKSWSGSTLWRYVKVLTGYMRWRVGLSLALSLLRSATQGMQLLMLVPLMSLIGLNVQQGSIGWLSEITSSLFALTGVEPTLPAVLVAFMIFTTLLALITRWQEVHNFALEEQFIAELRKRLYRAIANVRWLSFTRSRTSDFTHALTIELDRVGGATASLLSMVTNLFVIAVYVLLALRLSPAMTGLIFICGTLLLLTLRHKHRKARWSGEDISLMTNGLYSATNEHLSGMKIVKSYSVEERNTDIFSMLASSVARTKLGAIRAYSEASFWFNVGSALILSAMLFVAFGILSVPAASLLLLLFLFNRLIPLFSGFQYSLQQYLNALPAFEGVMRMMDHCESETEHRAHSEERPELRRGLRLHDISFGYSEEAGTMFYNLGLTIEAGSTTAIVGPSGAGKSTIADLVMGLILPQQGEILIDDAPLTPANLRSWRRQIGYVPQDTFLFNDTVRANLLWANPGATEPEMEEALRASAADEFVGRLPQGLDTVVGERGVRLSGGEKQRLSLARALLRKPSVLILDEATSALDSENEGRIQSAIESLRGQMTILIITHRLSTIRNADMIHVLEGGRLVESGSWDELSLSESRFDALRRAQALA